jgi:hypothetical protein
MLTPNHIKEISSQFYTLKKTWVCHGSGAKEWLLPLRVYPNKKGFGGILKILTGDLRALP